MKKRVQLIIFGEVQGVSFRFLAKRQALINNLSGTVKNKKDRTVEIIAEGEEDDIKNMIEWCNKGPEFSHVEKIDLKWDKFKGSYKSFEII